MKKQRYDLVKIIYDDLCFYGKFQLFLLLLVYVTAMLVVLVTYKTRSMIITYETLLLEKECLDTEWNALILKEEILSKHNKIEDIAVDKLKMRHVDFLLRDSICN